MDGISNGYIKNAIDELVDSLGIKESIPNERVVLPLHKGNTRECIESIADYLGLPIRVNLTVSNRFTTRALSTTDSTGQGVHGISAQVIIPSDLPFYGTPSMRNMVFQVQVGGDYQQYPLTFAAIMAHELSHLVLHSLWHREKNNEVYTDLAAMILGFSDAIDVGRKAVSVEHDVNYSRTSTTTYGYLADEQFRFALERIRKILKNRRSGWDDLIQKTRHTLTTCAKQLNLYRKNLHELNAYVEYLDRNPTTKRVRSDYAPKVVEVHGPGYIEGLASVLTDTERKLREAELLYSDQFKHAYHYTVPRLDSLREFEKNVTNLLSGFVVEFNSLNDDVAVLRRCVSFLYRLKVKRQVRCIG